MKYQQIRKFSKSQIASRTLYEKYLCQPIANFVVALVKGTSATPNLMTTVSLVFGVLMALSIAFIHNYWGSILGAIFYHLRVVMDCVDGTLARWKGMVSEKGSWWDQFVGKICSLLLIASLIIRIYPKGFWIGVIVFILFVYSSHRLFIKTKKRYPTKEILNRKSKTIANIYFEFARYHVFAIPFLLINRPLYVIYGFGIIELVWIIKTIICWINEFLKKAKDKNNI
ncbi:MAG: CDP-alcohol phosphatidyltransferase family protein [Candidatus Cloacimonetes bacterium]|nr:CDP-alcohol phosphatidyltransferase family protein [Candidatus Cloacimonadota bacterium]